MEWEYLHHIRVLAAHATMDGVAVEDIAVAPMHVLVGIYFSVYFPSRLSILQRHPRQDFRLHRSLLSRPTAPNCSFYPAAFAAPLLLLSSGGVPVFSLFLILAEIISIYIYIYIQRY